jgi:hypothetical protein
MTSSNEIATTTKTEGVFIETIQKILNNQMDSKVLINVMTNSLNSGLLIQQDIISITTLAIIIFLSLLNLSHHLISKVLKCLLLLFYQILLMLQNSIKSILISRIKIILLDQRNNVLSSLTFKVELYILFTLSHFLE